MRYLKLMIIGFIFIVVNIPTHGFSAESAAMKSLRQKYVQDHKSQEHQVKHQEAHHSLKKPAPHSKTSNLLNNKK